MRTGNFNCRHTGILIVADQDDFREFLEDMVLGTGKPLWITFFDKLGGYFNKRFGPDWKERDGFFKEFEESLRESEQIESLG
jgi:hypothetical protein